MVTERFLHQHQVGHFAKPSITFFCFAFFCAVLCTICISIYNRVYHFALLRKVCTVQILLCAHQQLVTNVLCVMWPNNQVELLALQIIAGTSQMGLDRSYCVLSINPALALLHLNLLTCTCPGDLCDKQFGQQAATLGICFLKGPSR